MKKMILPVFILSTALMLSVLPTAQASESLSRQIISLKNIMDSIKASVDAEILTIQTTLNHMTICANSGRAYAPNHRDSTEQGCVPLISSSNVEQYMNNNCGFYVDNPETFSLNNVRLANGSTYDLFDGNSASATLNWRCQ